MINLVVFVQLLAISIAIRKNLYVTDWRNDGKDQLLLEFDCLRISMAQQHENNFQEILSFCLNDWSLHSSIKEENQLDQKWRFIDLYSANITGEDLYHWSAPIDLIEQYQFYIEEISHSSISTPSTSSEKIFFNCTGDRFGPSCQYSLSFQSIIDYYENQMPSSTLTCYLHLECDRGSSQSCLDWTEICDGYVDCLNGPVDEMNCWQLQLNECNEDKEYRCDDGQCISKIYLDDGPIQYECLDRSDEYSRDTFHRSDFYLPRMSYEDAQCAIRRAGVLTKMTSSCQSRRENILESLFLKDIHPSQSSDCWLAFQCREIILFSFDAPCSNMCLFDSCNELINKSCPPLIIGPAAPVAFGHMRMIFNRDDLLRSPYGINDAAMICFQDSLCRGRIDTREELTCRHAKNMSITVAVGGFLGLVKVQLRTILEELFHCNTIAYSNQSICNEEIMYQCRNSSKCITKDRLCDGINDCFYMDDERCSLADGNCELAAFGEFFKCVWKQKCIAKKRVANGVCDCSLSSYHQCEDEISDACHESQSHFCSTLAYETFISTHLSFYTLCDGFTTLYPIPIDGQNHTDETECDQWSCKNFYTRCDGVWHCLDGSDELNCNDSRAFINCPSNHHPCVLPQTYQLICLHINKFNDGHIDCVGATDELIFCREHRVQSLNDFFYCSNQTLDPCIRPESFCSVQTQCIYGDKTPICNVSYQSKVSFCHYLAVDTRSVSEQYLCSRFGFKTILRLKYFSVRRNPSLTSETFQAISMTHNTKRYSSLCNRGLLLDIRKNAEQSSSMVGCFCPPSYFGDRCQYQNQRVSLTLKFAASSQLRRVPFTIVVTLIDLTNARTIHSSEQFTFLYLRDCYKKFNIYLLYGNRSKDVARDYFIHIDVYDKISLTYRTSFFLPLQHSFLPVHRIATLLHIPHDFRGLTEKCPCAHGRCMKYFDKTFSQVFCQCDRGWSGQLCDIAHNCTCSSDSLCVGITANQRSICICPLHRWGPRCLMKKSICLHQAPCQNGAQCIPLDHSDGHIDEFFCLCPEGFAGKRCEITDTRVVLTFDPSVRISSILLFHFIEAVPNDWSKNGSTFQRMYPYYREMIIRWSRPFHLAVLEIFDEDLYLVVLQENYVLSSVIQKRISINDRCHRFDQIFNDTISQRHLLRRMKLYHLGCQLRPQDVLVNCFYDGTYFCYCSDLDGKRVANCVRFNNSLVHDCFGQNSCENGARCLQDRATCPQTSSCVCPPCFHGSRCQFRSDFFGLTLDTILGYQLEPGTSLQRQSSIVQTSAILISIIIFIGSINGILSLLTFCNKKNCTNGCGYYLLGTSIVCLLMMLILGLKYWILIFSQIGSIRNELFLTVQCYSLDFLLNVLLSLEHWLNGCISIERMITLVQGIAFNKKRSIRVARYLIPTLLILMFMSHCVDPIHRRLLFDEIDNRTWCITRYTRRIQWFNKFVHILHNFVPFSLQIICSIIFLIQICRNKRSLRKNQAFRKVFVEELRMHYHLIVSPMILILLVLPRLIIFFTAACMKSLDDSWVLLLGYLSPYLSAISTFLVFVLPSKFYKDQLSHRLNSCRQSLSNSLQHRRSR